MSAWLSRQGTKHGFQVASGDHGRRLRVTEEGERFSRRTGGEQNRVMRQRTFLHVNPRAHADRDQQDKEHERRRRLHVVERVRKVSPKELEVTLTVTDPEAFAKPWTTVKRYAAVEGDIQEYVCEENNRNRPDANGVTTAK